MSDENELRNMNSLKDYICAVLDEKFSSYLFDFSEEEAFPSSDNQGE